MPSLVCTFQFRHKQQLKDKHLSWNNWCFPYTPPGLSTHLSDTHWGEQTAPQVTVNEVECHMPADPQTVWCTETASKQSTQKCNKIPHILPQNWWTTGAPLKPNAQCSSYAEANIDELNQSFKVQKIWKTRLFLPLLAEHHPYFGWQSVFFQGSMRSERCQGDAGAVCQPYHTELGSLAWTYA